MKVFPVRTCQVERQRVLLQRGTNFFKFEKGGEETGGWMCFADLSLDEKNCQRENAYFHVY